MTDLSLKSAADFARGQSRMAKVVSTGEVAFDKTRMEKRIEDVVLNETQEAVSGMNYLQIARDRGTISLSLQYAVSHLRNQLEDPQQVSTPPPDSVNWFYYGSTQQFLEETAYLNPIIEEDPDGSKHYFVHPAFDQFRQREISVWLIRMGPTDWSGVPDDLNAHWAVVVATTAELARPVFVPRGEAAEGVPRVDDSLDRYFDRTVVDLQLFDPFAYAEPLRELHRRRIYTYFDVMCQRAATLLHPDIFRAEPGYPRVPMTWKTGYVCYAILKEFFRRINVAVASGVSGADLLEADDQEARDLWDRVVRANYVGLETVDASRESMLAGCAVRAVQLSQYRARVAVELPGQSAGHKSLRLDPVRGPQVDIPRELDPEDRTGKLMIGVYSSNAPS